MSAQQIRSLLAVPDWHVSNTRTTEFLNKSLSDYENLDQLESLLQEAQIHNEDLQARLSSSNEKIHTLVADARTSAEEYLTTSKELSLLRHSLADELSELSNELVSVLYDDNRKPTLLEDIETLHRNLKELESVKGYVQVIQHGLELSESAVAQVKATTILSSTSITVFQDLQKFVEKVASSCHSVEDYTGQQKLHVVKFLEKVRDRTWTDIKSVLANTLTAAAEKLGWPMVVNYAAAAPTDRKMFEDAFVNLLRLQTIARDIAAEDSTDRSEKDGLYPIQALVLPVSLRFKYHFDGNRQTNRLDKPEWYFTHILNVAHEHHEFMDIVIQPLLSTSEYKRIHAWREFALLLLPLLSRKLRKTVPVLLSTSSILAHTIYQALAFDASLTEEGFQLQGTSAAPSDVEEAKWDGISNVILGNQHWFQEWLLGEHKFVEDQYQDIIKSSDAWAIVDDTEERSQATSFKSTNSTRRIKALFEQVTDRYSPLPNPSYRIHFFISIQLPILESYLGRITSSLDAFETLSSAFVRAVPGGLSLGGKMDGTVNINTQSLTSGIEGIQRLCKALLSAAHIELALESWAEDLFFLELWSDIHHNPALRERAEASPLLPQPGSKDLDVPQDTVFEVLINKYTSVIIRAENMIVQQVCTEVEVGLKPHFTSGKPDTPTPTDQSSEEFLISQTLLAPLTLFASHLSFLLQNLSQTSFTALYRRIVSHLTEHILHRQILFRGSFDASEGKRILAECELWIETCQGALSGNGGGNGNAHGLAGGRARVEAPWAKLLQAARLAAAEGEVWEKVVGSTFGGISGQEDWEGLMRDVTGYSELSRDAAGRVLRRRQDCLV